MCWGGGGGRDWLKGISYTPNNTKTGMMVHHFPPFPSLLFPSLPPFISLSFVYVCVCARMCSVYYSLLWKRERKKI